MNITAHRAESQCATDQSASFPAITNVARLPGANESGLRCPHFGADVAPPQHCKCGGAPELRRCPQNNSIAWQCRVCDRPLSGWVPHLQLPAIQVGTLPRYVTARERRRGLRLDLLADAEPIGVRIGAAAA